MPALATVLFDLDDTLFDHRHASREGLAAARGACSGLAAVPFETLCADYYRCLEDAHRRVLSGEWAPDRASEERWRSLFRRCGVETSEPVLRIAIHTYRTAYLAGRRAVPGVTDLLMRLRDRVTVGVVTNNRLQEQRDKLRDCGLEPWIDFMVTSEETGFAKPDSAIFEEALRRAGCTASGTVMVGDSWEIDIAGATRAGIRALWYNPNRLSCPDPAVAHEFRSYLPTESLLDLLFAS